MFEYWKKIDSLHAINRLLLVAVFMLFFICIGLIVALAQAPKRMEFWLTPAISANGGLMQANAIPDEYVHGFVASLIPAINTWSKAGRKEFAGNVRGFHYYFTPRFQQKMQQTLNAYQDARLFERTQTASLYRFLEPEDIKILGPGVWEVHVVLRITQRLATNSPVVIADKVVDYHFRVVRVSLSKLLNPFQLAIDGYTKPERLVEDLLNTEGEKDV